MHELPEGLTISLRSWRGSIYSNAPTFRVRSVPSDLEKGPQDDGDDTVLHPKLSRQGLAEQQAQQQDDQRHALRKASRYFQTERNPRCSAPPSNRNNQAVGQRRTSFPQTPASVKPAAATVRDSNPASPTDTKDDEEPLSEDEFYDLLGTRKPTPGHDDAIKLALPHGLYHRIQQQLRHIQRKYRIYDFLAYAFLSLQLLLSAVFIVLGSLAHVDSHIAIAVLGAFSTVIGGGLALMKGQGLPNRLRRTRDALRNVLFEAEDLYADVGAGREVCFRVIVKLREGLLRVIEDSTRNHPDTWNSTATGIAGGVRVGGKNQKPMVLARGATPAV